MATKSNEKSTNLDNPEKTFDKENTSEPMQLTEADVTNNADTEKVIDTKKESTVVATTEKEDDSASSNQFDVHKSAEQIEPKESIPIEAEGSHSNKKSPENVEESVLVSDLSNQEEPKFPSQLPVTEESKNMEEMKDGESSEQLPMDVNSADVPLTEIKSNGESSVSADEPLAEAIDNCYCGMNRNLDIVELQCAGCYKWFHESCIAIPIGKCLPFMTYYTFFCKKCNPSGSETFSKKQPNFSVMCGTTVANLTRQASSQPNSKTMFSKDKEIIPFIEAKWEFLTSMPRRIKQTWHATVLKAMMKDTDMFVCEERPPDGSNSVIHPIFGLVNQDLTKIGPSYETMARGGFQKQSQDNSQTSGFTTGKGRGTKRRFIGDGQITGGGKKVKSDLVMPKLPPNGYPLEHPFNKDGYRYILAEPDQHAPFRQEFDESQDWAGKPIPGWLYRKLTPNNILLALHDRAPQLRVSEDRTSVTGEKGYCMIRASHGVSRGTWYYEINIDDMPDGSATRLGWSQALGNLQAPLGYDKFSYSFRSRKGTKFHESRGYHYFDEGYGQGDTLGFLIHLPSTTESVQLPPIFKGKPLVKFKSYLYYEEKDETQRELKRLKKLPASKIVFYKNGQTPGLAFADVYQGSYCPAASLYKNCSISFNFGPNFKYPPKEDFKSMSEAAHDAIIEQTMTDLLFFTENRGKLRLDNI